MPIPPLKKFPPVTDADNERIKRERLEADAKRKADQLKRENDYRGDVLSRSPLNPFRSKQWFDQAELDAAQRKANALEINEMFATFETMKDLQDYFDMHTGQEKALLYRGAMHMWNHIAHIQNNKTPPAISLDDTYPSEFDGSQSDRDNYDHIGR